MGLTLGLEPAFRNGVNGRVVAAGEPFFSLHASTIDGGETYLLGSPPDRQGTSIYHLSAREVFLLIHVPWSDSRMDLARTEDGGATWIRIEIAGYPPTIDVAFSSLTDGLLVTVDRRRADHLFATTDGGLTWTRQRLRPPPGLPKGAETWLRPVLGPQVGNLLTLRAISRREGAVRPEWEGTYAYVRSDDGWDGPLRLPMGEGPFGRDLLVPGPDGRLWGASGHDVWVGDDLTGPWRHRPVRLPDDQEVADIFPVANGVVWLTSTWGVAGGGLYRSDDDGAHWTQMPVTST
jgi:hypothetical protein